MLNCGCSYTALTRLSPNAPASPTTVSASALSSSEIEISWNGASGADGYNVWSAVGSNEHGGSPNRYFLVASTTSTFYTHTGLLPNTTYNYKVSAYNSNYGEGSKSSGTYATTYSIYALAACCTCGFFAYSCKKSRLSGLLMQFTRYKNSLS
ncbi:MAG: fibronectin type III domain-containing protein [Treponema sp.]|nr:fibronectin type III domain-containing protein [Treponema sp.]